MAQAIKTIGSSGQISLGKEFAGRTVVVESTEPGTWIIKTARVIPDNEQWMLQEPMKSELDEAIRWAEENPTQETNLKDFQNELRHGDKVRSQ